MLLLLLLLLPLLLLWLLLLLLNLMLNLRLEVCKNGLELLFLFYGLFIGLVVVIIDLLVQLVLFVLRRYKHVVDAFFYKVIRPVLDELLAQEISLIDAKNEFLVARHRGDVLFQVLREVEVRVARVDDLQQNVRFFDDAPKLLPDFDVLLERRDGKADVVFLDLCEVAAPVQECSVLIGLDLLTSHAFVPFGPPRDVQRSVLRVILGISDKFLDDRSALIVGYCCVAYNHIPLLDALKLLLGEFSQLHELLEAVLL